MSASTLFENQSQKRRVFFSFHYQNDIWRVNQVRNSWRFQHESRREAEGFFDASIWERSKRTSDEALKALIREGLKGTSVTCVLSGEQTFLRRWVRYEIARSLVKGNGFLVVRIHKLKDRQGLTSPGAENPLDHIGTYKARDGGIFLAERDGGQWKRYADYTRSISLPNTWRKPNSSTVIPLSTYAREYCYVTHNGAANFATWVRHASGISRR